MSQQEFDTVEKEISQAPQRDYFGVPLTINRVFAGHVDTFVPYAHGGRFLLLNLDEKLWYDSRVILRFAQFGGMGKEELARFDKRLLEIARPAEPSGEFFI